MHMHTKTKLHTFELLLLSGPTPNHHAPPTSSHLGSLSPSKGKCRGADTQTQIFTLKNVYRTWHLWKSFKLEDSGGPTGRARNACSSGGRSTAAATVHKHHHANQSAWLEY